MFENKILSTRAVFISTILLFFVAWLPACYGQNAPYPQSPVISDVIWDSQVSRDGAGSDGWPTTWADDGKLYTTWADGFGFNNSTPKKSLGFSKVTGSAQSFTGTDFSAPSGEQTGNGKTGKKASGMLMVNGTLYMWVRNANNNGQHCQLAKSTNHGGTWTWSNWKFSEFGFCTFINYGKNYAGARDSYVYMVSPNSPSAYTKTNHMILTRVPKGQIMSKSAYEYFKGIDQNGNPTWTSNINQRQPVFTNPGQCLRSGISYNPGLGRYLWWQHLPGNNFDTRYSGGFGIYDAPEPWGPWTTVYFTEQWDIGPGELGHFPTKWMSADGKTAYLVFSGDDNFSVRKATFTLQGGQGGGDTTPPDAPENLQGQPLNN